MFLINPYRFGVAYDAEAQAYITAVQTADGQALETGVRDAINAFVVGCKADGIWSAIKASCILAGARTLSGALVPLVGTAPTNNNFASGDYNRKTGLVGNGSNKYIIANRAYNSIPANNEHMSCYRSVVGNGNGNLIGGGTITPLCISRIGYVAGDLYIELQSAGNLVSQVSYTGFMGSSRSASTSVVFRRNSASVTLNASSVTRSSTSTSYGVFCGNYSDLAAAGPSASRLSFYSIGESLNLALLDSRVTTLVNALAAAIP